MAVSCLQVEPPTDRIEISVGASVESPVVIDVFDIDGDRLGGLAARDFLGEELKDELRNT